MEITKKTIEGKSYLGKTATIKISEIMKNDHFKNVYGEVGAYMKESSIESKSMVAVYKRWDMENDQTDLMPAYEVVSGTDAGEYELFTVESREAIVGIYQGAYQGLQKGHQEVMEYLQKEGIESDLTVEDYVVNPFSTQDSNEYITHLVYYIKK